VDLPGRPYPQTVLRFWDVKDLKEGRQFHSEEHGSIRDYAYAPDGKTVAVAWIGATVSHGPGETTVYAPAPVTVLDVATGKEVTRIPPPRSGYAAVAFSPDGTILATQDNEGVVKLWERTATVSAQGDFCRSSRGLEPEPSASSDAARSLASHPWQHLKRHQHNEHPFEVSQLADEELLVQFRLKRDIG
jgi:WD40 repeat protein